MSAHVRLSQIGAAKGVNPRRNPGDLEQLTASIREHGLLQPLVVRPAKGRKWHLRDDSTKFEIIAGERRFRALRSLRWRSPVPVIIRTDLEDDDRACAAAVAENSEDGRHNLSPMEVNTAIWRLHEAGWLRARIAKETGLHKQTVYEALKILEAPKEVHQKAAECELSHHATLKLTQVPDDLREEVVRNVRRKATAGDVRRLRMDVESKRRTAEVAEEAEQELSRRAAPAAWKSGREKTTALRALCHEITQMQDEDPYTVELLNLRAMAWTLFWVRGDLPSESLSAIPDPEADDAKSKNRLNLFEKLLTREAATFREDDADGESA